MGSLDDGRNDDLCSVVPPARYSLARGAICKAASMKAVPGSWATRACAAGPRAPRGLHAWRSEDA